MPIIDLQRRLVEVGRIRTGGRKPARGAGRKLEHWRLSSSDQQRLEEAAKLWGGKVEPWADAPNGAQFDLLTETAELPIMLLPGQALSQWWETWSGGGCSRRCDGEREVLSDQPCLCDASGKERTCKPTTRLSVMLPDVPGLGCWRLESHGFYAAVELSATAGMLEQATARGQMLRARLRLEQRRKIEGGQTLRYAVPVIDIDVTLLDALQGIGAANVIDRPSLEAGDEPRFTPVLERGGVSVSDGLAAAARQAEPRARTARSAEPIGAVGDFVSPNPVPVPAESESSLGGPTAAGVVEPPPAVAPAPVSPEGEPASPSEKKPTAPQLKKLNLLVGKLREAGSITTEQLWAALGRERSFPVEQMVDMLNGKDEEGVLHWSPLRESLTRVEATSLIDRLETLQQKVAA